MRKNTNRVFLYAIIISMIASSVIFSIPNITGQEEEPVTFTVGTGEALVGNWDTPIWSWTFSQWCAELNAEEFLFYYLPDWQNSITDAKSYLGLVDTMTIEYFPEEMNSAGFINSGGISAVEVDIREGVTFHDGSILNASVVKWNFDRLFVIAGNLTGQITSSVGGDLMTDGYYCKVSDYTNYFTENWNHSDVVTPQYYGKDNDPDKSFTTVANTYVAQNKFPNLNKTLIVTPGGANGGGRVRFEYNSWSTGLADISTEFIMSKETYKDYFDTPIVGFGETPGFVQGLNINHLVGTGPYEFVSIDTLDAGQIIMKRYENWWNLTDVQARGYGVVENLVLQMYDVSGSALEQALTTAALAGDIDFAWDQTWNPLDRDPFDENPNWDYYQDVDLAIGLGALWFNMETTNLAQRKAIAYAFDYDAMINIAWEGKAERCRYPIGQHSQYYNGELPYITKNLTIARQTLLDDPTYGPVLTAAGLTINSPDFHWNVFATTNDSDLFTFNYFYDDVSQRFTDVFIDSLHDIGFHINASSSWALTGVLSTFWGYFYGYWAARPELQGCWLEFQMAKNPLGHMESYFCTGEYWNWGNINNSTISNMIYGLKMQDEATKQENIDTFCNWVTQEAYPHVYIYQKKNGYVISKDWEINWFSGFFAAEYVKLAEEGGETPTGFNIPGFSFVSLFIFCISGIGLIYLTIRKKRVTQL
ncbi:MAG: ABC transporter substrate-binding protein [Promethearchaeota archaeon]